jgi:hypothetical protein
LLLLVLDVHNIGAGVLAGGEGISEDDVMFGCLERVSCVKVFIWFIALD